MTQWALIESGRRPGAYLMQKDQSLLVSLTPSSNPILHLYEWEGLNATYGYFIRPADFLHVEEVIKQGLLLSQRPTGGGILFHVNDLAFSVLIPAHHPAYSVNTLDNYAYVNNRVVRALQSLYGVNFKAQLYSQNDICKSPCASFCMAKPTQYDIMLEGKKIGGAAQRRTKQGFLHQGSLFLAPPPYELMKAILKDEGQIIEAMKAQSCSLLGPTWIPEELASLRHNIQEALKKSFSN